MCVRHDVYQHRFSFTVLTFHYAALYVIKMWYQLNINLLGAIVVDKILRLLGTRRIVFTDHQLRSRCISSCQDLTQLTLLILESLHPFSRN